MPTEAIEVGVAQPHERRAALELVLRPVAPDARAGVVDAVAAQPRERLGPLDALIVARTAGRVVAATWAQPSPGRAAGLWPPVAIGGVAPNVSRKLLLRALDVVDAADVAMTQALFEKTDDTRIPLLESVGFERIAELLYLGRSLRGADACRASRDSVRFVSYAGDDERLMRVIEATYQGTLDCPAMEGRRDPRDVLHGYRTTGRHDPADWLLVQGSNAADDDLGVLLMTEHPASMQYELVYMGLVPEARGRGLGRAVVDEAIKVASQRGAEQLMVAVDAANAPARRVYDAAGFAAWASKQVYVRSPGGYPRSGVHASDSVDNA